MGQKTLEYCPFWVKKGRQSSTVPGNRLQHLNTDRDQMFLFKVLIFYLMLYRDNRRWAVISFSSDLWACTLFRAEHYCLIFLPLQKLRPKPIPQIIASDPKPIHLYIACFYSSSVCIPGVIMINRRGKDSKTRTPLTVKQELLALKNEGGMCFGSGCLFWEIWPLQRKPVAIVLCNGLFHCTQPLNHHFSYPTCMKSGCYSMVCW